MEEIFPNLWKDDFKNCSLMLESNFMKKLSNVTTRLYNFNDFRAEFEYLKKVHPDRFSQIHFVIHFHPSYSIISHPHFLMSYYYLLSDAFQNKTILLAYVGSRCVFESLKIMVKPRYCSFKSISFVLSLVLVLFYSL